MIQQTFSSLIVGNRNLARDLIGILLALVIGIGGQILVSDPLRVLAPQLPMLSPQDWPGSWVTTELWIASIEPWNEKREFRQTLSIENDMHNNSHIDHKVFWYADPKEAVAAWNQPNPDPSIWQEVALTESDDKPASRLWCVIEETPDSPRACTYFASWEHWYTEVQFWSQFDEDLRPLEMQQITARVDQLLISAPNEPCYWILCTGEGRNEGKRVAIFVLVIMLIATAAILRSGARTRKELSSTSSAENLSTPFPHDEPKAESILPSPASEVAIPFPKEGLKNTFKLNRKAINLMGVPLTAALMMGLLTVLAGFYARTRGYTLGLETMLSLIVLTSSATAGGGAIGVRVADLSWRQAVLAAVIAGAGSMLISGFEFSPFYPGARDSGTFRLNTVLIGLLAISAPIFLMPLFDPAIRRTGPAPSTWKVIVSALCVTLFLSLLDFANSGSGLGTLVFGIFLSGVLIAIGLISALGAPKDDRGAWIGGLGILLAPLALIAWPLLGGGWFP